MKVIESSNYTNWSHEIICDYCKSKLEINCDDLFLNPYYGVEQAPIYVKCAVCDDHTSVNRNDIPYLVIKKLVDKFKKI